MILPFRSLHQRFYTAFRFPQRVASLAQRFAWHRCQYCASVRHANRSDPFTDHEGGKSYFFRFLFSFGRASHRDQSYRYIIFFCSSLLSYIMMIYVGQRRPLHRVQRQKMQLAVVLYYCVLMELLLLVDASDSGGSSYWRTLGGGGSGRLPQSGSGGKTFLWN